MVSTAGSSPRMRGTPPWSPRSRGRAGIIPAYAGNTSSGQVLDLTYRDHPRVCGEHLSAMSFVVFIGGSSPRMRGTLSTVNWSIRDRGIIPAYAGNTAIFPTSAFIIRDHPRVCGEHAAGFRSRGASAGIIPAYAGNTSAICHSYSYMRDHPRVCGEHHFQAPC